MKVKRLLLPLLMAMVMMAMCPVKMWAISGSGTSGSHYKIASASDWANLTFQSKLMLSSSDSPVYIDITADFTLTSVTLRDNEVYIVLDGQGHTISLSGVTTSEENTGLFGKIGGGEVKNLHLGGNLTTSKKYMGNLCGKVTGTLTISNVLCSASLANTTEGDATAGGFIGQINGDVTFNNCGYTYKFYGKGKSNQICGMVGYRSSGTVVFNNCFCKAVWDNVPSGDNYAYMRNDGSSTTYNNCYYVTYGTGGKATDKSSGGPTEIDASKFSTGELAFLLNSQTNGKYRWYQNIDNGSTDSYPWPYTTTTNTHARVYYGYTHGSTSQTYSNSERWSNQHMYYNTLVSSTWSNTDTPASCKVAMSYKCSTCNATASETLTPSCKTTNATCTVGGNHAYTATSTTYKKDASNYHSATTNYTVSKLKHGCEGYTSSYAWSGTYDAPVCKFTLTCTKCAVIVVNAQSITPEVSGKTEPKCTTKGTYNYKAKGTFAGDANSLSFTDSKYSSHGYGVPALGHDMTTHEAHESTCTEAGNYTYYTCSRSCCANKIYKANNPYTTDEFTDIAATVIAAKGHTWRVNPTWSWADDGSDATCTLTCNNDTSHKMTFDKTTTPAVNITSTESKAATCTEAGEHTYQASVTFNDETYTSPNKVIADIAPSHTFAATDITRDACTKCYHGFMRYNYWGDVSPQENSLKDKDGNPLTIIRNENVEKEGRYEMEFNKPLVYIGDYAFGNLWYGAITDITIPNTVTSIGEYAFCSNEINGSLIIPNSVTSIGKGAFSGAMGKITSVTLMPTTRLTWQNGILDVLDNKTLYVPYNLVIEYKKAEGWKDFAKIRCISHTIEHAMPKAATCTDNGYNSECWHCAYCDACFSDEEGTSELSESEIVIPATGHTFVDGVCSVCGLDLSKLLCFTAEEDNASVTLSKNGTPAAINLIYSTDSGATWSDYTIDTAIQLVHTGDKLYLCAKDVNAEFNGRKSFYHFALNKKVAASGDATTLLNIQGTLKVPANAFYQLFSGCGSLTTAPDLPATTLANGCYEQMFNNCSSLTTAPDLPATTLADGCYSLMFYGCSSLTTAPDLPATTLANGCYGIMFYGCSSLSSVTVNFTDWNTEGSSANGWLVGVASTGTFICPDGLDETATDDYDYRYVPEGWTVKRLTKGDLNDDGNITIADLTLLVQILNSNGTITNPAADVDGNGSVTVDDVNALGNKILGK